MTPETSVHMNVLTYYRVGLYIAGLRENRFWKRASRLVRSVWHISDRSKLVDLPQSAVFSRIGNRGTKLKATLDLFIRTVLCNVTGWKSFACTNSFLRWDRTAGFKLFAVSNFTPVKIGFLRQRWRNCLDHWKSCLGHLPSILQRYHHRGCKRNGAWPSRFGPDNEDTFASHRSLNGRTAQILTDAAHWIPAKHLMRFRCGRKAF